MERVAALIYRHGRLDGNQSAKEVGRRVASEVRRRYEVLRQMCPPELIEAWKTKLNSDGSKPISPPEAIEEGDDNNE